MNANETTTPPPQKPNDIDVRKYRSTEHPSTMSIPILHRGQTNNEVKPVLHTFMWPQNEYMLEVIQKEVTVDSFLFHGTNFLSCSWIDEVY